MPGNNPIVIFHTTKNSRHAFTISLRSSYRNSATCLGVFSQYFDVAWKRTFKFLERFFRSQNSILTHRRIHVHFGGKKIAVERRQRLSELSASRRRTDLRLDDQRREILPVVNRRPRLGLVEFVLSNFTDPST